MKPPKRQKSAPTTSIRMRNTELWTVLEKKQLLGALKLHPKDDLKSIKKFVPTRSEPEIEFFLNQMWIKSDKILEDVAPNKQVHERAPIENWLETMQALTNDETDYSFVITNIMSIAGNLEPHGHCKRTNIEPNYTEIYRYITALLRGTATPKLDKLRLDTATFLHDVSRNSRYVTGLEKLLTYSYAAILLDLLQGLSNHIHTLDTDSQRRIMLEKVKLLHTRVDAQNPKRSNECFRKAMEEDQLSYRSAPRRQTSEATPSDHQTSANTITVEPQPSTSSSSHAAATLTSAKSQLDVDAALNLEATSPNPQSSTCTITVEPQPSTSISAPPVMTMTSSGRSDYTSCLSGRDDESRPVKGATQSLETTKSSSGQYSTDTITVEPQPSTSSSMTLTSAGLQPSEQSDHTSSLAGGDVAQKGLDSKILTIPAMPNEGKCNEIRLTVMTLSDGTVVLAEYDEENPESAVNTSKNINKVPENSSPQMSGPVQTSPANQENSRFGAVGGTISTNVPVPEARNQDGSNLDVTNKMSSSIQEVKTLEYSDDLHSVNKTHDDILMEPARSENPSETDTPQGDAIGSAADDTIQESSPTENKLSASSKNTSLQQSTYEQSTVPTTTNTLSTTDNTVSAINNTTSVCEKPITMVPASNTPHTSCQNTVTTNQSSTSGTTGPEVETPVSTEQRTTSTYQTQGSTQNIPPASQNTATFTSVQSTQSVASSSQISNTNQERIIVNNTTQGAVPSVSQTPSAGNSNTSNTPQVRQSVGTKRKAASSDASPPKKNKLYTLNPFCIPMQYLNPRKQPEYQ